MSPVATALMPPAALPAARRLAAAVLVVALLVQAFLALPVAVRMAAEAMAWAPGGWTICSHAVDGTEGHTTPYVPPTHEHAQCLVCQAHAVPLGLLACLAVVIGSVMVPRALGRPRSTPADWRCQPFRPYRSRAPPAAA